MKIYWVGRENLTTQGSFRYQSLGYYNSVEQTSKVKTFDRLPKQTCFSYKI